MDSLMLWMNQFEELGVVFEDFIKLYVRAVELDLMVDYRKQFILHMVSPVME
jgi:hypothetical protein